MIRRNKPSFIPVSQRRGLLIDLENLAYNRRHNLVRAATLTRRLQRVLAKAQPAQYVLAVAPRGILQRYGEVLALLGVRWRVCVSGPDAADAVLFGVAEDLIGRGYGTIVIASGDHYFATIADMAELIVVLPGRQRAARRLQDRAVVVAA